MWSRGKLFNREGKGREWIIKITQAFPSLQGCWSPTYSSEGKTAHLKDISIIKSLLFKTPIWIGNIS